MKYNGTIEAKLRVIEEKLEEIESWKISSLRQLNENSMLRNATERALQVAVEAIIDVCERIMAVEKMDAGKNAASCLERLISEGIISNEPEYVNMIRFRNFIVHRYEKIDTGIIFTIVSQKLYVFRNFIDEVRNS